MSHSHRTMEERIRIEVFVSEGLSCRNIARRLGRHHTTLVCASRGKAALLTCHERTSRFLLLAKVENKTAASFNAALLARLCELPRALPQSLTLDNAPEMAGFSRLLKNYISGSTPQEFQLPSNVESVSYGSA